MQGTTHAAICFFFLCFVLFCFVFPIPFIILALLSRSLPQQSNSDPGSHSGPSSPPPTTERAFIFYREKNSAVSSLADWRRDTEVTLFYVGSCFFFFFLMTGRPLIPKLVGFSRLKTNTIIHCLLAVDHSFAPRVHSTFSSPQKQALGEVWNSLLKRGSNPRKKNGTSLVHRVIPRYRVYTFFLYLYFLYFSGGGMDCSSYDICVYHFCFACVHFSWGIPPLQTD